MAFGTEASLVGGHGGGSCGGGGSGGGGARRRSSPSMAAPPALALLGAGVFARDAYAGILAGLAGTVALRAIWSRSREAAEALLPLVQPFAPSAEARWGSAGLQAILDDPHVHCVAVVLPIQVQNFPLCRGNLVDPAVVLLTGQPEVVIKALRAGKHVLQEKPVGATLAAGLEILQAYRNIASSGGPSPIWAVAENFRFETGLAEAGRLVRTMGRLMLVEVNVEVAMNPRNKYFACEWRRDPGFTGGFITDCGVHFVAATRLVLIFPLLAALLLTQSQHYHHQITWSFVNGATGVMSICYSAPSNRMSWRAVCAEGTVEVSRSTQAGNFGYLWIPGSPAGEKPVLSFHAFSGIEEELKAFAEDVASAVKGVGAANVDKRSSPEEALIDLAVIEAALQSGVHGGGRRTVQLSF
eukprot:SM000041S15445  [mRNA]  locus=s41:145879:149296:+ [translate_table: standard]